MPKSALQPETGELWLHGGFTQNDAFLEHEDVFLLEMKQYATIIKSMHVYIYICMYKYTRY